MCVCVGQLPESPFQSSGDVNRRLYLHCLPDIFASLNHSHGCTARTGRCPISPFQSQSLVHLGHTPPWGRGSRAFPMRSYPPRAPSRLHFIKLSTYIHSYLGCKHCWCRHFLGFKSFCITEKSVSPSNLSALAKPFIWRHGAQGIPTVTIQHCELYPCSVTLKKILRKSGLCGSLIKLRVRSFYFTGC